MTNDQTTADFCQRENQLSHCHTVTHASHRNPVKCSKSRLVTTSAPKHFIPKVAYFYPKSGVLLGASIYVKPLPSPIPEQGSPTRSLSQKGRELVSAQYYSRTSHLAPSKFAAEVEIKLGKLFCSFLFIL